MMEKIEWYREVLELEPNSKVFFPLAKLLVENNETSRAINVLEQGLERHPDFMEARLLLIELMYKDGQQEACATQIAKLSKMFASYAGFWQAWAACLATEPGEEDTASIIRFLAAHFLVGPLKISEALNLGLAEIIKKHQAQESTVEAAANAEKVETIESDKQKNEQSFTETSPPKTGAAVNLETLPDVPTEETTEEVEIIESSPQPAPPIEENEIVETQVNQDEIQVESPAADEQNEVTLEAEAPKTIEEMEESTSPEPHEDIEEGLPPITLSEPVVLLPEDEEKELETLVEQEPAKKEQKGSESFSLRTRSMAEVLAEQGDYQGSLEIYQELVTQATNAKEKKILKKRIEELKKLSSVKTMPEEESSPFEKKEKLLGFLESLAKRVETRMNN